LKKHLNDIELSRSILCAELCYQSYGLVTRHDEVKAVCVELLGTKPECFQSFLKEYQDTQAMVLNSEDEIYLVFPGTDGATDISTDVNFELVGFGAGHIHKAFLDVSSNTYPKIIEAVKNILASKPDSKLIVTGHSLGGALAMLYTFMLRREGIEVEELITFGQPRVGNGKFAKEFAALSVPYTRFVNKSDIVPDVPPPWDKHDWTHAGKRLTFNENGALQEAILSDETDALRRVIEVILRAITMWFQNERKVDEKLKASVMNSVDHGMVIYLKNLKNLIRNK